MSLHHDRHKVEHAARALLDEGRLLTWAFPSHGRKVVFFIPNDCHPDTYPTQIAEHDVILRSLPRPVARSQEGWR